jgi:transaldolase
LLFGLRHYIKTAEAYIAGMEARRAQGKPLTGVSAVAGFILSPIDVLVDSILRGRAPQTTSRAESKWLTRKKPSIAIAKVAYRKYLEMFRSERFLKLADNGAAPLKFLWTSACTRKPGCDRLRYVEELIGQNTIQAMDAELLDVYRHRGNPMAHLEEAPEEAFQVTEQLNRIGIDLDAAAEELEKEAVRFFIRSFNRLIAFLRREYATNYWH